MSSAEPMTGVYNDLKENDDIDEILTKKEPLDMLLPKFIEKLFILMQAIDKKKVDNT